MKSVFPIFFILLNLFFILYLPRKLSIWVRLALYLSIGGLFYLWMSNKSALTSLFAHTISLQPFDVFHETIGFSLLVTIFLNLFDLFAVPSIVRFPNLILKNPQTPPSVCSMVSCQYFPFRTLFPLFLRFLLLSHILWHMARSLPIINLKNKGTSSKCPFVYIQTALNIFNTQSFPSLEKCSISNPF